MTSAQTSSSRSSTSLQPWSSSHTSDDDLASLDPDQILERLTYAKAQAAHFQELFQQYLDALDQLVQENQIESDLHYNDWHIYRQKGKITYTFPDSIREQEADLKQSKELAIALGDATIKHGKPFWTLRYEG